MRDPERDKSEILTYQASEEETERARNAKSDRTRVVEVAEEGDT